MKLGPGLLDIEANVDRQTDISINI